MEYGVTRTLLGDADTRERRRDKGARGVRFGGARRAKLLEGDSHSLRGTHVVAHHWHVRAVPPTSHAMSLHWKLCQTVGDDLVKLYDLVLTVN